MKQEFKLYTIVFVSQSINPKRFDNIDKLQTSELFPDGNDWKIKALIPFLNGNAIQIQFDNSVSLLVEQNRLQIIDNALSYPLNVKVIELAQNFLKSNSNEKFIGIGVNFQHFLDYAKGQVNLKLILKSQEEALKDMELLSTTWKQSIENVVHTIRIEHGTEQDFLIQFGNKLDLVDNSKREFLIVNSNFNLEIGKNDLYSSPFDFIQNVENYWNAHCAVIDLIEF